MLKTSDTMLALSAHVIKIGETLFAIFNFSKDSVSFNEYSFFFCIFIELQTGGLQYFAWVSEVNSVWYLAPKEV